MPRFLALAFMVGMTLVLAVCGGVSDEEFEAVQQDLTTERTMVADLKEQLAKAQATPTPLAPLALADAYAAALNAGDVDALVAIWADDAIFSFGPFGPAGEFQTRTSKAEVLQSDLDSIADNARLTLSNSSLQGNTVIGEFSITDDDTASFGIPFNGTFEAVAEAGTIKSLTATLSEETQAAFAELFGPPPGPPPQAGEVTFTAFDTDDGHRFRGPDSLPAGWTTLRLSNESQAPHHMQLIQLPEGMTLEDLFAAFQQPGPPPAGLKFSGGVGALFPAGSGLATVNLEPGSYVMLCFIPDENGVPHAAGGMVKPLLVTAATGPTVAEPEAVATVEVSESGFSLSGNIPAGVQTVKVINIGQAPHEAVVASLAPGATGSALVASLTEEQGLPPGKLLGGLQSIDGGSTGYFTAVFEPGNHVFIEFDGGVTQEFTVE